MAFRHEVLHIRRQKQRLIDIPAAKILAHRPRLNQTRSELNSRYSDRLLGSRFPSESLSWEWMHPHPLRPAVDNGNSGDESCALIAATRAMRLNGRILRR